MCNVGEVRGAAFSFAAAFQEAKRAASRRILSGAFWVWGGSP